MEKLTLTPNAPVLIALRFPQGRIVQSRFGEEQQVQFSLVDGRTYYASLGVAQKINDLKLGDQEEFYIAKKQTGKAQYGYVDVWLRRDKPAPQPEPEPSLLERQLAASIHEAQARKAAATAPVPPPAAPPQQGTGTYGPVAVPRTQQQPQQMAASWAQNLLTQTNQLIEVYADACRHAEQLGVPNAVVRTVMLSAFIGLQKKGNY